MHHEPHRDDRIIPTDSVHLTLVNSITFQLLKYYKSFLHLLQKNSDLQFIAIVTGGGIMLA